MSEERIAQRHLTPDHRPRRIIVAVALLGIYLTLRGYHSRDGDQAYRLPLLLHQQSPSLYRDDPFVRAFDRFNPHRGALLALDLASKPLGLSAGIFVLFALTFFATAWGVNRLARACWPDAGTWVELLALVLFLTAKAGNIGTNHLFEAMLLDRLQAFALGWVAIAAAVGALGSGRAWIAPACLGLATLIHPSAGLQLALVLIGSWTIWAIARRRTGVAWKQALANAGVLGVAVLPGLWLNAGRPDSLLNGLSADDYWTLAVELQSPQHMLPHLWRRPQWLAWGCYLVLAALSVFGTTRGTRDEKAEDSALALPRNRLILMLGVILAGLAAAWFAIEVLHDVRVTVFQPFRMATIARGLCLILISGHVLKLWGRSEAMPKLRAALLAVGLCGDWLWVVATAVELTAFALEKAESRLTGRLKTTAAVPSLIVLVLGIRFLSRHDTESGHVPLLITLALVVLASGMKWWPRLEALTMRWLDSRGRIGILACAAWALPMLAMLAGLIPAEHRWADRSMVRNLTTRYRFQETPTDDIERLAAWCRIHTPEDARFIGPPGPKAFRLWSRRSLAFNRASSPYHAAGLADWFARFQDHVGDCGPAGDFVRRYTRDRHGIEARYQSLSDAERAELSIRQGASHVIAAAPRANQGQGGGPLELLHVEGRYAAYRVRPDQLARSVPGDHRQR